MVAKKPVPKERFLLWMLATIFGFQAVLFAVGTVSCHTQRATDQSACPELGRRYDQTFGVMIATVLALLGASKTNTSD